MSVTGSFSRVSIKAIAVAVPGEPIPNSAFVEALGEKAVRKFERGTGIRTRYHAQRLTTADLAEDAAKQLLARGTWKPDNVDACFFLSQTFDAVLPSTACVLHGRLGLQKSCLAMDMSLGCSGFVYGLQTAAAYIEAGVARRVLLLGGDCLSKALAPDAISDRMLLGDAGFAVVLEANPEADTPLPYLFGTDGTGAKAIVAKGFAPWNTLNHIPGMEALDTPWFTMDGMAVFGFTINVIPPAIEEFCNVHRVALEAFDQVCLHQANLLIIKQIGLLTNIPEEKLLVAIDRFANTSPASIPLTLCAGLPDGVSVGHYGHVLFVGFGVGLSWGVMAYDFSRTLFCPVSYVKEP